MTNMQPVTLADLAVIQHVAEAVRAEAGSLDREDEFSRRLGESLDRIAGRIARPVEAFSAGQRFTPPAETPGEHQYRLRTGWATWEPDPDLLAGRHGHAHDAGPFFGHRHEGGTVPHDHEPYDPLIPAQLRHEFNR